MSDITSYGLEVSTTWTKLSNKGDNLKFLRNTSGQSIQIAFTYTDVLPTTNSAYLGGIVARILTDPTRNTWGKTTQGIVLLDVSDYGTTDADFLTEMRTRMAEMVTEMTMLTNRVLKTEIHGEKARVLYELMSRMYIADRLGFENNVASIYRQILRLNARVMDAEEYILTILKEFDGLKIHLRYVSPDDDGTDSGSLSNKDIVRLIGEINATLELLAKGENEAFATLKTSFDDLNSSFIAFAKGRTKTEIETEFNKMISTVLPSMVAPVTALKETIINIYDKL